VTPSQPVPHLNEPDQPDRNLIDLLRAIVREVHLGDLMRIELELHPRMAGEGMRRQGIMEVVVVDIRGVPGE
jgi:hypothetical protein